MRSYVALMQSFAVEPAPQAKRRKLEHVPESKLVLSDEDEDLDAKLENSD